MIASFPGLLELDNLQLEKALGTSDISLARKNLKAIYSSGMTHDLLEGLEQQLQTHLPENSDPNRALNNLERFIAAARSSLALGALFERDPTGLPILLKIFGSSQYLSDYLIRDTESYDTLRLTEGQLCARDVLIDELIGEIATATDESTVMAILRRFKHRETLRIAFGDLIVEQRVEQVAEQISFVADAICSASVFWARKKLESKWGVPLKGESPADYVILAMGKLGGIELNYSSDIDLIMVYENDGRTANGRGNREFFERLTRDVVKLLSETTDLGAAYRVDLRLRPDGKQGRICNSLQGILQYYDLKGRTWERQALIKARPVAGNELLGKKLLTQLEPWIYRRNFSRTEISGIQSLKRQIERRALVDGELRTNVKTGHGGIRDVEFVIQFLQLLNGFHQENIRTTNTLEAIQQLRITGALSHAEATLLVQNYQWLRKVEHRLQLLFDLQTHTLPTESHEIDKLAKRLGYSQFFKLTPKQQFEQQLEEVTESNRKILDHVLHRPFGENGTGETGNGEGAENIAPPLITDAILHPSPSPELVHEAMAVYPFGDPEVAFQHAQALAREKTRFLSQPRCRHFLAAIAHPLLTEIGKTPDPDKTLVSLRGVSDSLGAKASLWELFSHSPASLNLYVQLCASSDYLVGLLVRNPGMIDDLIHSLMLAELPSLEALTAHLKELTTAAVDIDPIIHSFKHAQHLGIGVRDILGIDSIETTHLTLSHVAEICLKTVAQEKFSQLAKKAFVDGSITDVRQSGFVILALGKLGGQEPNYHSDLDVVFLYHPTDLLQSKLSPEYTPQYFFSRLAAAISKDISFSGKFGRLYEIDSRLRPTGKSGALAVSFKEFTRYFESGDGQLWERQALCKARVVLVADELRLATNQLVREATLSQAWHPKMANEIYRMRMAMQENCTKQNLKRGIGGTVDIEFGIQLLQLQSAQEFPENLQPGTISAARSLTKNQQLDVSTGQQIVENYQLLRSIESRLRLMDTAARHDLPDDDHGLAQLTYLLNYSSAEKLVQDVVEAREWNRNWFESVVKEQGP